MTVSIELRHRTTYRYDREVMLGPQIVRLRPAPYNRTPILRYALDVTPRPQSLHWQQDPAGNLVARLTFPHRTRELIVDVGLRADLTPVNPFDFLVEPSSATCPLVYEPRLRSELAPYLTPDPAGPLLSAWLRDRPAVPCSTVDFLVQINQRLCGEIAYVVRPEPGVQGCEETLASRRGSCRDSVWLLVQILRHLGLAARFVSGYLIELDKPRGSELHAWADVYLPGAGWIGLDPTSGLLIAESHIPLAVAPTPEGAAPITGTVEACEARLSHEIVVSKLGSAETNA